MDWYYVSDGQQVGPLSDSEFRGAVAEGRVQADTLVWREGLEEWQSYAALGGGTQAGEWGAAPTDTAGSGHIVCCECGRAFSRSDVIRYEESWVCTGCKPVFFQRVVGSAELPVALAYAGFLVRLGAKIIDGIILWVVNLPVGAVLGVVMAAVTADRRVAFLLSTAVGLLFGLVLGVVYTTFFLGRFGATPGKMVLGLKVVRPDGSPISYARACGRHLSEWISGMTFGFGYLMAAFDEEKRSLHDRICDTRVVRR